MSCCPKFDLKFLNHFSYSKVNFSCSNTLKPISLTLNKQTPRESEPKTGKVNI